MIRWRIILRFLAYVAMAGALTQLPALCVAVFTGDAGLKPFLVSTLSAALFGIVLYGTTRPVRTELNMREGILIVGSSWIVMSALGAIPFFLSPVFPTFTDAWFESVSGFTTTGSTILPLVEKLPASIQLWRCFTHWIGGMGIIVLGVAILPLIGVGGMVLYRAEFSGARSEKLTPRIAETASSLWKIYLLLTLLQVAALMLAGMNLLESLCHTFSTLGTGGFSTRNLSVAAFHSPVIEGIIIAFMLLSGVNFTLQYRLLVERRVRRFFTDTELRHYVGIALLATAAISFTLIFRLDYGFLRAIRDAAFQVASIMTTTGFASADYELWTPFAQLILVALMFCGGCTGSTAGGLKTARIVVLLRVVGREFRRMVERRGVFAVRFGDEIVDEGAIRGLLNLVYLAFLVNFAASLTLTALGIDVLTAITSVAACMFNVGPGLAAVGPFDHYGWMPGAAKWVLSFCMLAGRLEFYTLLVMLAPGFWKK